VGGMTKLYQLQEGAEREQLRYIAELAATAEGRLTPALLERFRNAPKFPRPPRRRRPRFCVAHCRCGCRMMRLPQPRQPLPLRDPNPSRKAAYINRTMAKARSWHNASSMRYRQAARHPALPAAVSPLASLFPPRRDLCNPDAESEEFEQALQFSLPFCLRAACRAQSTHALRTHALLQRSCLRVDSPRASSCPFHKSLPLALEWAATAHPPGKHVRIQRTNFKEGASTMFNKVISSAVSERMQKSKPRRTKGLRRPQPATSESWKNDKGEYEPAPSGTASTPGQSLQLPRRFRRAAHQSGGEIKYRTVEEDVESNRSSTPSLRSTLQHEAPLEGRSRRRSDRRRGRG